MYTYFNYYSSLVYFLFRYCSQVRSNLHNKVTKLQSAYMIHKRVMCLFQPLGRDNI